MRVVLLIALLSIPQVAIAADPALSNNRERSPDIDGGRNDVRSFEAESQLQRDLLGRKVIIDPDSKIDPGSLMLDVAPGSTVIIKAHQTDRGVQKTKGLYKNVEMPN